MTQLVSQWATDSVEVSSPVRNNMPSKMAPQQTSQKPPQKTPQTSHTTQSGAQTKPGPFLLDSKWANAPDTKPHTSKSPGRTNAQLLTPPQSSGKYHSDRRGRRRSDGKLDYSTLGRDGPKPGAKHFESSNNHSKHNASDHGHSLASRIGNLDVCNGKTHHNDADAKLIKGHVGRGSRSGKSPIRRFSNDNEEYRKGPMTAAAKSFASRLGVPDNSSSHRFENTKEIQHSRNKSSDIKHSNTQKPDNQSGSTSKYMTPKQKRAMEEEKRQRELAKELEKERELREEKLKEEARKLFENMSDKTTNWADIEDE